MTIQDLLDQIRQLAHRGQRLSETTTRFQLVDEEAAAEIETYKADPSTAGRAYGMLGWERHEKDAKEIARTKRRMLSPRLNLHLYEGEHLHRQIASALAAFVEESQQPPTIETAFRRYTNSLGVSADQILALATVEQLTIANLRAVVPTLRASQREDLYRGASKSPYEPVAAVTIRYLEETEHPYPETGPLSETELTAAATFGRLKQEARAARVPAEVADVQKVLNDVAAQIKTARRVGALPLNPEHQPDIAHQIAEAEAQEQAQAGA